MVVCVIIMVDTWSHGETGQRWLKEGARAYMRAGSMQNHSLKRLRIEKALAYTHINSGFRSLITLHFINLLIEWFCHIILMALSVMGFSVCVCVRAYAFVAVIMFTIDTSSYNFRRKFRSLQTLCSSKLNYFFLTTLTLAGKLQVHFLSRSRFCSR